MTAARDLSTIDQSVLVREGWRELFAIRDHAHGLWRGDLTPPPPLPARDELGRRSAAGELVTGPEQDARDVAEAGAFLRLQDNDAGRAVLEVLELATGGAYRLTTPADDPAKPGGQ